MESWGDLRREGDLACAVPTAYGGMGLDMATYIPVIRPIARGGAATRLVASHGPDVDYPLPHVSDRTIASM